MGWAELSSSKKIVLSILSPILIISLFISIYFVNSLDEIDKLKKAEKALLLEIDRANQIAAKYEDIKAKNEELKKKLEELTKLLPKEEEVSGILKKVSERGIQRGLTLTLWKPEKKEIHSSNEIYEIPVSVGMKGKYHIFGGFFSDIHGIERILNFKKIDLKSGGKDSTLLIADLVAVTYSIIPEEEKKKLQEQKKGK